MTPFPSKYLMCRGTNGILTSYVLTQMGALSMLNLTMQAGDVTLIMQHLNHLPSQKLEHTKKAPKQLWTSVFCLAYQLPKIIVPQNNTAERCKSPFELNFQRIWSKGYIRRCSLVPYFLSWRHKLQSRLETELPHYRTPKVDAFRDPTKLKPLLRGGLCG